MPAALPKGNPAAALARTRRMADQLAQKQGSAPLRKRLEAAQRELNARLAAAEGLKGPGKDSFTAAQLRVTLAQVQETLVGLKPGIRGVVTAQSQAAAAQATRGHLAYMERAEKKFRGITARLPLNETAMLDRAVVGAESTVLHRLSGDPTQAGRGILSRYGDSVVQSFETELQDAMLQGKPWAEVRADLVTKSPFLQAQPASWAERIVRTETMAAYNKAGAIAIAEANKELGDMVKILSATFDSRTGWDSYQVHGQIRLPDEAFEWNGMRYMNPPNRPNDREVVVPHRISWPIPAELEPRDDSEVFDAWAREKRKGAPPPRPEMSTVDRALFGAAPEGEAAEVLEGEEGGEEGLAEEGEE